MSTPFTCQYCGKDTSEVEYDYLNGYDHLSCTLENQVQGVTNDGYELCIVCGAKTNVKFTTHVDHRLHYIEGAGQLCKDCYDAGTDRRHFTVPFNTVYNTPNDSELGAKVRRLYYEAKNNS